jgi:hypothetical protein
VAQQLAQIAAADAPADAAIDPDLARVVDAWQALPEPLRQAVLAIVESAVGTPASRP